MTVAPPSRRRRLHAPAGMSRVQAAEAVLGLAAVGAATWTFAGFYAGLRWLPFLVGAVLLGGGAVAAGVLLRLRWWGTTALAAVAVLLLASAAGYAAQSWYGLPTAAALRSLGEGLVGGLPAVLAIGLPADPTGELLVVPVLLAGLAGALTVLLVLRSHRVTPLVLPALLLFTAGLALTASRGGPGAGATGVLALLLLGLLLVRSNRLSAAQDEGISESDADAVGVDLAARRRRSLRGRLVLGLPAVVVLAVLAVLAGWLLPVADGSDRVDPRSLYRQPFELDQTLSPLTQVRPQLTGPDELLFRVEVRGDANVPPDRVRVAVLDTFDGALWTRGSEFVTTGSTLPGPEPMAGDVREVTLHVAIERMPQPFLPVTGEPVRFEGTDFAFDRATGTVVSTRDDVSRLEYTTTGMTRRSDRSLKDAVPSATAADAAYRALPDQPPWVEAVAARITEGRSTPMDRLLAVEAALRAIPYNREALPGHSYGALYQSLFDPAGDRVAGAEQLASAFVVLARTLGYPARVAVGYRLPAEARDGDGFLITTGDAHAWPEVHLAGHGWVAPFEPTNTQDGVTSIPPRPRGITLGATTEDRDEGPPLEDTGPGGGGDQGLAAVVVRSALVAGAVAAGLVALLVAVVALKGVRRRWRSRRGPPAVRVVAAWREVADRLTEAGVRVPASATGREVARGLAGGPAAPVARHVAELAPLVAGAVFAYDPPDEAAARRAWELERRIHRELGAAIPLPVRLRGLLDPRPLVPRRRDRALPHTAPARVRRRERVGGGGR